VGETATSNCAAKTPCEDKCPEWEKQLAENIGKEGERGIEEPEVKKTKKPM
jgi:hypothetical protein